MVENEVRREALVKGIMGNVGGEIRKNQVDLKEKGSEVDLEETVVAIESPYPQTLEAGLAHGPLGL